MALWVLASSSATADSERRRQAAAKRRQRRAAPRCTRGKVSSASYTLHQTKPRKPCPDSLCRPMAAIQSVARFCRCHVLVTSPPGALCTSAIRSISSSPSSSLRLQGRKRQEGKQTSAEQAACSPTPTCRCHSPSSKCKASADRWNDPPPRRNASCYHNQAHGAAGCKPTPTHSPCAPVPSPDWQPSPAPLEPAHLLTNTSANQQSSLFLRTSSHRSPKP